MPLKVIAPEFSMVTLPAPDIGIAILAAEERLKVTLPLFNTEDVTGPVTVLS